MLFLMIVILSINLAFPPGGFAIEPTATIFSPPAQIKDQEPYFTQKPEQNFRKRFMDGVPTFREVQQLPTLSPQQKMQLHALIRKYDAVAKPFMEEMKKVKANKDIAQGQGQAAIQKTKPPMEAFQQLKAAKDEMWKDMQKILSPEQIQQIEIMRKGQLIPQDLVSGQNASSRQELGDENI